MGTGIADMTCEVLAKVILREAAPAQGAGKDGRDVTARQDGGGLEATWHAGVTQNGEPEKRQPQQQPKPKTNLQLTLQPEPQNEPKPKSKPTPIPTSRWETV
jgi:hypothetical protein